MTILDLLSTTSLKNYDYIIIKDDETKKEYILDTKEYSAKILLDTVSENKVLYWNFETQLDFENLPNNKLILHITYKQILKNG